MYDTDQAARELMSRARMQNAKAQNEERHPFLHEAFKSSGHWLGKWGCCICVFFFLIIFVLIVSAITS